MARYGRDLGSARSRGRGYDMRYGGTPRWIAQSRDFQQASFRGGELAGWMGYGEGYRGAYDVDWGAGEARRRQARQERRFQEERAAPGEELGWGRQEAWGGGRRRDPEDWQPQRTTTAGDLMTESPEVVTPDVSLADAAKKMRDLDVGIIPVVEDMESRRLLGVITDRDIAVRAVAGGKTGKARVEEYMTREVESCRPDDRVREVIHVMERARVRRVPIVDHAGSLVGIIAQADLAVDYAEGEEHRELRVEDAIERISEPARPRRGRR